MDLLKNFRFNTQSGFEQNIFFGSLFLALLILTVAAGFIYLAYTKKKERYKIFKSHMHNRGFSEEELKKMFGYLYKTGIEPSLILENKELAKRALKAANLDLEESLKKLGFDKDELIKRYLQKQKELRKKWNS